MRKVKGVIVLQRENWASRLGFMLAAMGSAVGLGNIWRFSYVAGENGGGAFLIIYLLSVLIIGVPLLLTEVSIGRKAQSDVVGSYQKLAPKKPWYMVGFLGIGGAFLILGFYSVVAGWAFYYLWNYLTGQLFVEPEGGYGAAFGQFTSTTYEPLFWHGLFMVITMVIVLIGIKKGIELANKIFMPILAILLLVLAGYSVTLDGAMEGLAFLFKPDWSVLSDPFVYIAALGQAFFSLSLGVGTMMTYGSYLSKEHKLPGATVGIGLMDTLFAVISGIVIFPAVFAFGIEPASGPPLVFITLPSIFEQMPFGSIVAILFFLALCLAAVSSSISLLEVPVAYFMRVCSWSRRVATIVTGSVMFVLGVFVSLGFGIWSGVTPIGDRNILDSMDYIASNIFLPIGGLVMAIFIGWYFTKEEAFEATDLTTSPLRNVWLVLVRYIAPILIAIIFLNALDII
ncbi:sodium-dependent transporter [Aquibacillus koreensis]|uniref:Sodium-dependent transporter n=1 Tax=Aquibacillus koreensis TaxID=279446 RepID=A0A9X3WMA0_9BACI|nr:sodium-dependent transporter [Aquibacillus koreensis]MCT2538256.1 sodium-dependent transporter [Aquibacillus koreensis]MDC3420801.1 sodium-dependent transporter [Aquibacillus koreensis]